MESRIRVGTASWSDHDEFYPPELSKPSRRSEQILFYGRYFDLVEVDVTFYRMLPSRTFAAWAGKTPDDFVFDVKAYRELTFHDRDEQGHPIAPKDETFAGFRAMVDPLRRAGKLGALAFQFPPWFQNRPENVRYLEQLPKRFPEDVLSIEFRHRNWLDKEHAPDTFALLREAGLAYTIADEPQLGSGSVPPVYGVTSPDLAIFRFHGRNKQAWYKQVASSKERFNYLYSREEVEQLIPQIYAAAKEAREVHVITNNNARNYAVVNAADFKQALGQQLQYPLPEPVEAVMGEREARSVG